MGEESPQWQTTDTLRLETLTFTGQRGGRQNDGRERDCMECNRMERVTGSRRGHDSKPAEVTN
jgi:hypothetical protein